MARATNLTMCSFCGKSHAEVRKLIAGPGVYICDSCINVCKSILDKELNEDARRQSSNIRFRNPNVGRLPSRVLVQFLVENAFADVDATVADINARAGDQLAHLGVALATERAHGEVGRARHIC